MAQNRVEKDNATILFLNFKKGQINQQAGKWHQQKYIHIKIGTFKQYDYECQGILSENFQNFLYNRTHATHQ